MNLQVLYQGGNMTRLYSACFSLLAYLALQSRSRYKFGVAGVFCGVTFMFQQNEILPILGWFGWITWQEKRFWGALGRFVAGNLIIVLPVVLWLTLKGALGDFLEQAFLFNYIYVSMDGNWLARFSNVWVSFNQYGLLLPTVVATGLAVLAPRPHPLSRWLAPALFALLFQLVAIMLSGRFISYYFYGLVPLVCILLAIGLTGIFNRLPLNFKPHLITTTLVIAFLFTPPVSNYILPLNESLRFVSNPAEFVAKNPLAPQNIDREFQPFLEPLTGQRGQLFIWNDHLRLHLYSRYRIISPTKWAYTFFWRDANYDPDNQKLASIFGSLDTAKTKYILEFSVNGDGISEEARRLWQIYLTSHYTPVYRASYGATLWQRII
jgi:hypothetical protein